jgi:5'-nucleotidase
MTAVGAGERPLILVSNDDGISAPGILALASALDGLGEIVVVAPITEQSAVGHSITIRDPVRATAFPFRIPSGSVNAWAVHGTPADCVKLAIDQLLPRQPDLVVSGINQGPNAAVNIIYSGTVSAATEATILGIPAIAFSYCRWVGGDYEASGRVARTVARRVLDRGLREGILLNVNIPDRSYSELKGIRITRQARAKWEESFTERKDPFERPYYWLAGTFVNLDSGTDTDLGALEDGYVSVTPIHHDLTAHQQVNEMASWQWDDE